MRHFVKRLFDIITSAAGLIVISPLLMVLVVLVRLKLGSPILFCQQRPGLGGKTFIIYKFRTMTDQCDASGNLLPDSQRLPAFGRFLRSTSFDELPELLNVLKGDMSIVGPRPLMMKYLGRYSPEQARRHEVKPGITGWAQINGRNAISWEDKFKLDVWYVDHWTLWLDMKIILKSIWMVITREGITQQGRATMDEFMGTRQNDTVERPQR
ncbi:MAG: sugar transferase [Sedimentisphaerales bacterium]|jgi:lipopolysaccharide/colanic/teichoic acid biosynthesis glycosyltransferase